MSRSSDERGKVICVCHCQFMSMLCHFFCFCVLVLTYTLHLSSKQYSTQKHTHTHNCPEFPDCLIIAQLYFIYRYLDSIRFNSPQNQSSHSIIIIICLGLIIVCVFYQRRVNKVDPPTSIEQTNFRKYPTLLN